MRATLQSKTKTSSSGPPTFAQVQRGFLQRKCACGGTPGATGECEACGKKKLQRRLGNLTAASSLNHSLSNASQIPPIVHEVLRSPGQPLDAATRAFMEPRFGHDFSRVPVQTKLTIGASNDPLEQEADQIAEQVLAAPTRPSISSASPRIHRFSGQTNPQMGAAPVSVDRVLAGSGGPLEPELQHDMELRFGHDFCKVRVHTGDAAGQSAREINADAYTAGHNIVFGAGRFAPGTHEGRRLIAHELTHVVQQGGASLKGKGHNIQRRSGANLIQRAVTETKHDSHAGLFELTRHNPITGPAFSPQSQYDVRLEFLPYDIVDCDQVAMTQTAMGSTSGVISFASPARRNRSLVAGEGTVGVGIDRVSGRSQPYYGTDNLGTASGTTHFGKHTPGTAADRAWLEDAPGFDGSTPASSRTPGMTDSTHFETCAICKAGKDKDTYYGCVNWGYDIDAADTFTEDNFALVSKGTPSTDFLAAGKKWNDQTVPVATADLPLPTHKTKQTSMTEAQLKAEIITLETTLKGLAAGHVNIPQITFEIKVYKDILDAMADNNKLGYSALDIKAIQAVVGSAPNGTYDFDTITNIKKWQVEQGLKGDGRFGPTSKTKFDAIVTAAVTANKAKGFTADQIKTIQVEVGSKDDGAWGPITVKPLMVWQKDHSLPATGEFDVFTRVFMFVFGGF
jgi:hypothetical protein